MTVTRGLSYLRFCIFCISYSQILRTDHTNSQVNALVYHQFQPSLSRVNRQPQASLAQTYNYNGNNNNALNASDFMTISEHSYQRNSQHQPLTNNRQQKIEFPGSSATYTRESSELLQEQPYSPPQNHHLQEPIIATDSPGSLTDSFGCPLECHCNRIAQIADCSNKNLTRIPSSFPKDIKRIRLERNNITEIAPYAFQGLRRLQRIDLSNNNLHRIDSLAFFGGLQSLNSLILYSNKLENLPENVFDELAQLQLLLLNANSLQTIPRNLFRALANLNLLSLYDNNIDTLPSGTFEGLKSIKTM